MTNKPEVKKFYREVIVTNKAQCLSCGDIIESTFRHDFRTCSCGKVSVDGGKSYLKRSYETVGCYVDLSETYQEEREPYDWEIKE